MSIKRDKIFFTLSCFQLSFTQIRVCWQICVAVALRACAHAHVCMCLSVRWNVRMHALFAPCFSLFSPPPPRLFSVVFHLCYLCLSLVKRPDAIYKHARAYLDKISHVHAYTLIYMHTFTHSRANKYIAQWTALIVKSIGLFCALYPTFTVSKDSNKIYFWSFVHLILGFANFICPVSFSVFLTTPFFCCCFFNSYFDCRQ